MHIFGYLAPNEVQPYLDTTSFNRYKQAQKDLRNVCLVSKQMVQVARLYLYRAAIVNNVDVLAYLLRTLDENQALGQHLKRLVLEVPFILEDVYYRKPNTAVLESRPNYSEICAMAFKTSDISEYERQLARAREFYSEPHWNFSGPSFVEWAWERECEVLGLMYFEILLRTKSLESLCLDMICAANRHFVWPYLSFLSKITQTTMRMGIEPGLPFMAKFNFSETTKTVRGPTQDPF
ncbi:hypothetical protein UCDDA912_g04143 [Diaporthe ampelina]|uniref:Uncharacterized protein n=1 Tax=Diaporthe ampelina TaxID=1214573 RepID=A0A0G2FPB9_9PEZI|nr:hypothetical protein UCDDA912_g04143 [Diaporthe ampelina]